MLVAAAQLSHKFTPSEALLGELGLGGEVRPVRGIIGKLLGGRAKGITTSIFLKPICNRPSLFQI